MAAALLCGRLIKLLDKVYWLNYLCLAQVGIWMDLALLNEDQNESKSIYEKQMR